MNARLAMLLCLSACALAQEPDVGGMRYRVGASWTSVRHTGTLRAADPTSECGEYADGSGQGGIGSAGIEWPIAAAVRVGAMLAVSSAGATFITRKSDVLVRDAQYRLVPFVRDYTLTGTLTQVAISCDASLRPFALPLSIAIGVGPELRFASRASQSGTVVSPDGILFPDSTTQHSLGSASLPGIRALGANATAALAYEIPISSALSFVPELRVSMSFPSITTSGTWRTLGVSFGATLAGLFSTARQPVDPSSQAVVTTIIKTAPALVPASERAGGSLRLEALGLDSNGSATRTAYVDWTRARARVVTIRGGVARDVDTILSVIVPRAIVLTGLGRSPQAASWTLVGTCSGDTILQRSGSGWAPPVVLWQANELREAMNGRLAPVKFATLLRDSAGRVIDAQSIEIPVAASSGAASGVRVQRYCLDSAGVEGARATIADAMDRAAAVVITSSPRLAKLAAGFEKGTSIKHRLRISSDTNDIVVDAYFDN
jgi:hypothetical protein